MSLSYRLYKVTSVDAKRSSGSGGTRSPGLYEVELIGLDTFDPTTIETDHRGGDDVPCWMLDADYNNRCFRATQVFFPRTGAWESLKKALRADYDETVWDHLGRHAQRAVRGGGAPADCREGDRRPRQRAAGPEGAGLIGGAGWTMIR